MKYILTVAYDGFDYQGWQVQSHAKTVAGTLAHAFKAAFRTDVRLIGASRTDAGVHARGQVVSAVTALDLDPKKLKTVWNRRLPSDIHIRSLDYAPEHFHPLKNVAYKTYYYYVFTERPMPGAARYGVWHERPLDARRLKKALKLFVGTHDFRSFCTGTDMNDTVRTVHKISVRYDKKTKAYSIIFQGAGFLHHMIRRIVGAALHVASYPDIPVEMLARALEARDARQRLPVAEPHGLILHKIVYKPVTEKPS